MRVKRVQLALCTAVVFCLSMSTFAKLIPVEHIDMTFIFNTWYDYTGGTSGNIDFDGTSMADCAVYTVGDNYSLKIVGQFFFTSALERDFSSGGRAQGYFDFDNVTIEIKGALVDEGYNVLYGGYGVDAVTILKGTIAPLAGDTYYQDTTDPTDKRWLFDEYPGQPKHFDKSLNIILDDVGIAAGIAIDSNTVRLLDDPRMDLNLESNFQDDDPLNFISQDINSGGSPSNIDLVAPEPMTGLLLGLGLLYLRRRKV